MKTDITDREAASPGSPAALSVGVAAVVLSGARKGDSRLVGVRLTIGKAPDNDLGATSVKTYINTTVDLTGPLARLS